MLYSTTLPYSTDAALCYSAISDLPWALWLDSAGLGRFDILSAHPMATLVTHGANTEIQDATGSRLSSEDPFDLIRQILGAPAPTNPDIPFCGGAIGYWGYDLGHRASTMPASEQTISGLPDMAIGIYDWAILIDHQYQLARLVSQQRDPATAQVLPLILARLKLATSRDEPFRVHGTVSSNLSRESYESAFNTVKEYLHAGDCYQINLAQRFSAAASGDALDAYLKLRLQSPAPYSAFLNLLPHAQILCASPERFLRVHNGQVETKPIKGTRPRSSDPLTDIQFAEELHSHPKDRAENLMIVDLLRNDLNKSCAPGSVRVPKLFEVESFANVHHLVSTVEGKLRHGRDALHLLRDCFPGGSVTGAPKQRAMQIIEKLEPAPRGVYCGTIGYIGFDGNMDTNIVIRTLVYAKNEVCCWAGGGIVADSKMVDEYQETMDKAAAMLSLLQQCASAV